MRTLLRLRELARHFQQHNPALAVSRSSSVSAPMLSPFSTSASSESPRMKNIVVIGASYVGNNAAKELAKVAEKLNGLQKSGEPKWRVLMLDKKSHFQHLFAFPR